MSHIFSYMYYITVNVQWFSRTSIDFFLHKLVQPTLSLKSHNVNIQLFVIYTSSKDLTNDSTTDENMVLC